MDFDKLMSFAADVQVDKVRNKFNYKKSPKKVNPLVDDTPKVKGINSPSVQAFLKKQALQEKKERDAYRRQSSNALSPNASSGSTPPTDTDSNEKYVPTNVVTGIRKRVGASTGVSSSKRALEIMAARKPIAVATVTATPAPNSCLVKAADSAVHTARVRAETERKKFVAASDKKHRKHRRHHRDGSSTTTGSTEVKKPKIDIKKRREKPTQSFEEILRLAKEKLNNKSSNGDTNKSNAKKDKVESSNRRPMTQEEKDRDERKKSKTYTNWLKFGSLSDQPLPTEDKPSSSHRPAKPSNEFVRPAAPPPAPKKKMPEPSTNSSSLFKADPSKPRPSSTNGSRDHHTSHSSHHRKPQQHSSSKKSDPSHRSSSSAGHNGSRSSSGHNGGQISGHNSGQISGHNGSRNSGQIAGHNGSRNSGHNGSVSKSSKPKTVDPAKRAKMEEQRRKTEEILRRGGATVPTPVKQEVRKPEKSVTSKPSASSSKPTSSKPILSTWDRITGHMKKPEHSSSSKKKKRREQVITDSDEYSNDSDMDDFLDDGPDSMDYSSHIKEIFGYDRNKFKNESSDTRGMETGFHQQIKEENKSLRLAKKEDQDDMKADEQYYKAKASRMHHPR